MPYLRFIRCPGIFTAFADILAGFLIIRGAGLGDDRLGWLPQLLVASACFYLAGMAWNDLFDVEEDRVNRPERPLPSGEITLTNGYLLASALIVIGLMLAMTAGYVPFFIAAALVVLIFAYNGFLKPLEIIGPAAMGGCRGLNLLLGMSAHPGIIWSYHEPAVYVPPLLLTLYGAAITVAASWENGSARTVEIIAAPSPEPPTVLDESALISTPPTNPDDGKIQSEMRRRRELRIVMQQNALGESKPVKIAYHPPKWGVRIALLAVVVIPLAIGLLLPQRAALVFVALWLLLLARPLVKVWRVVSTVNLRGAVGTALAGICLFDAALAAGFSRHFFTNREEAIACGIIAVLTLPVFALRRFIT